MAQPTYRAVKGMNDVLPDVIARWQRVERAFATTMGRAGYHEVRTPLVEPTALFVRSIGEVTDVVEKEMYSFRHHDDDLTIRPEGTAGAARAYVENRVGDREPVSKWFYMGPMFRAERPAKGRYRQFYQLGAEVFGDAGPGVDAELIELLVTFLNELGIEGLTVHLGTIGGKATRARYRDSLVAFFQPKLADLSDESRVRLEKNPLRILDSKDPRDQKAVEGAPNLMDVLDDADKAHFSALQEHLKSLGIEYVVDPKLVRGLDYYTRTLFEIKGRKDILGAGDTLVGGGRYDGMLADLGGSDTPAIGFAAGLERLVLAMPEAAEKREAPVFVATLGERAQSSALALARDLRNQGLTCLADVRGGSLKSQLRRANSLAARFACILGDTEIEQGVVMLKDLDAQSQDAVPRAGVADAIKARLATALMVMVACWSWSSLAHAQRGGARRPPTQQQQQQQPRQPAQKPADGQPTPPAGSPAPKDPSALIPDDPLKVSEDVEEKLGSDHDGSLAPPSGPIERKIVPIYEEKQADAHASATSRFLPPFILEYSRSAGSSDLLNTPANTGVDRRTGEDREGLYGLFYYRRRSPKFDADVLFPLAWRIRDDESTTYVMGPLAHREAPQAHDNWIAPLVFEGKRKDGGYLHIPGLLFTSHWNTAGAFTLAGPYFRDRTGSNVDIGVAPFFFHGDNGNVDGGRRTYTLIPPLLFYQRKRELEDSSLTVIGPVISERTATRNIFDVAPFYFQIRGRRDNGGIDESHTTLFPFFHYGHKPDSSLFIVPGYVRRKNKDTDTMLTPFYSNSTTRNGSTSLTMAGPILPLFYRYRDYDLGEKATGIFPFYYGSDAPTGSTTMTPLFGRWESYGVSKSYWLFPTITYKTDNLGWSSNVHPLVYISREKESQHTVFAPLFWDFKNASGRSTVGFPLYWRFADTADDSVTQVAGNTLYRQKRVEGGLDWSFHVLPVFSYGKNPNGYYWNVLFGLTGYERNGQYAYVKALWLPITVDSPKSVAGGPSNNAER